jgi:hypothetical protein
LALEIQTLGESKVRYTRLATVLFALFLSNSAFAGSDGYNASSMWGTTPSGNTALESSTMHVENGIIAGQVNAAEEGLLYSNGSSDSYNIYSIGSQSVINNTIQGDDNSINVTAEQTSENTGDISNNGHLNTD